MLGLADASDVRCATEPGVLPAAVLASAPRAAATAGDPETESAKEAAADIGAAARSSPASSSASGSASAASSGGEESAAHSALHCSMEEHQAEAELSRTLRSSCFKPRRCFSVSVLPEMGLASRMCSEPSRTFSESRSEP